MEKVLENLSLNPVLENLASESRILQNKVQEENKNNIKSIILSPEGLVIKDEPMREIKSDEVFQLTGEYSTKKIPGVYWHGVQYYDLKDLNFINNTGMAHLIDLMKSLLEKGIEARFVNVNEKIQSKIKSMGLDHIINCGEK
jgi:ABC-type transporter Mla MlaB component